MLHLWHYPRACIAERVQFTPADRTQIATCRGPHNRLGVAYQLDFLYLTGRFPTQQPLEILGAPLAFVVQEVALDPTAMQDYALRQATVSAHQELIRLHLGFARLMPPHATPSATSCVTRPPSGGLSPRPPCPAAGAVDPAAPCWRAARAGACPALYPDDGLFAFGPPGTPRCPPLR